MLCKLFLTTEIPVDGGSSSKVSRFDPRFDDRCGEINPFIYSQNYAFIEDVRKNEKQVR
jgi:hypothetical protein